MIKHNQDGGVSGLGVSLVLALVLFIGASSFGLWAFMSRQDYKNNVDQKIKLATSVQQKQDSATEQQQLAQDEKQPLTTYNGPSQYGSIVLKYPKTWSALVDDTGTNSSVLIDSYFGTPYLPALNNPKSVFALRMQVLNQSYSTVTQSLLTQSSSATPITSTAYALPNVKNVVGVEVSGNLPTVQNGSATMVILPLRANTLEIWTVGNTYLNDFNNIILPNFSFSP